MDFKLFTRDGKELENVEPVASTQVTLEDIMKLRKRAVTFAAKAKDLTSEADELCAIAFLELLAPMGVTRVQIAGKKTSIRIEDNKPKDTLAKDHLMQLLKAQFADDHKLVDRCFKAATRTSEPKKPFSYKYVK